MNIKPEVLKTVADAVIMTGFGTVTLIVQDAKLIQMDKMEKVRFVPDKPSPAASTARKPGADIIQSKICSSLTGLQYGQVTFVIKEGVIVQIERTEKQRIPSLQGVYGDGI